MSTPSNSSPTNVLILMTDQQRHDAMSCAGNHEIETPNIDRLAREGVRFSSCHTANPVCVPARATLLTGLSSPNVGVERNIDCLKQLDPVDTFDSALIKGGYRGEYYGKWHTPYQFAECYDNTVHVVGELTKTLTDRREMDVFHEYLTANGAGPKPPADDQLWCRRHQRPYHPNRMDSNLDQLSLSAEEKMQSTCMQQSMYGQLDLPPQVSYPTFHAEQTLDALERLSGQPFTLTCSFDPPHPPHVVQEPYYSMYDADSISVPSTIDDDLSQSPYPFLNNRPQRNHYQDPERVRTMRATYYAQVREIDDWVGTILDKLDQLGLTDNTLVIFLSDHGEMLGDHGLNGKFIFFDQSIRVPLIMRLPGHITAGTVVDQPVSLLDVCPTILDYCGQPSIPSNGISLRAMADGQSIDHDVVSFSVHGPHYLLRSGSLKLMMPTTEQPSIQPALYDIAQDPEEMHNLVHPDHINAVHQKTASQMHQRLIQWLKQHEPQSVERIAGREPVAT